ncbi:hypothetical protein DdX_22143 [Ditylenchus destructor]|uniref:Uncharacterized protein n=1 Tax=Ditylenchus destructor TaxID=166010 RepID=A0AAD4QUN9_9BILA|nr:hypothetical protein DdX_22143 [Ditylenchus destructor]
MVVPSLVDGDDATRGGQHRLAHQVGDLAVDDVHIALRAWGQFRVVGDHHDGGAGGVDLLQQFHHPARHLRVQVAGRFVGQQQARAAGQGTGDRRSLLLAAGKFIGVVLHARAQADLAQRLFDALAALAGAHFAVAQRHVHVVEQVEIRNQVEALEDEADLLVAQAAAGIVAKLADVLAIEHVGAAGEGFQQAGDIEEGGLAEPDGR